MNTREIESASRELTDLATRMYSDDLETIARVFERAAADIRQSLEHGGYMQAYGRFIRGTKPE